MKTKFFNSALALCAISVLGGNSAQAQDVFVDDAASVTEFTCDNSSRYYSTWRDNWFIELSAGANQPLTERGLANPEYADRTWTAHKWTASYSVGVGRWMTPQIGLRLKANYGAVHWDAPMTPDEALADLGWSKSKHANLSLEFMWDIFNTYKVNPNRVFSLIPFIGIGGDANWDFRNKFDEEPVGSNVLREHPSSSTDYKRVAWTLPVSAGLQFRFRLCKYVDFFAEARALVFADNWNNHAIGYNFDCLVQAMGGFNFNIGGRDWGKFNECEYVSQIAALNGQVNDLRAQLIACGETVAALQRQLPCPEVVQKDCKNAPLMATVRFTINSTKILPTEEVNIYTMAEWLKANPGEKIIIAGYADKDTGTPEYNMGLSQRRAEVVKNSLVNDYGIDPSRLQTTWFGSDVQEYPSHNDWNRIVIFKQ